MAYRIQFSITDNEYENLVKESIKKGYPNVSELAKERTLRKKTELTELYIEMINYIKHLEPETEFRVRDCISCPPPALLGRWLFEDVKQGLISDVIFLKSDNRKTATYKKIRRNG